MNGDPETSVKIVRELHAALQRLTGALAAATLMVAAAALGVAPAGAASPPPLQPPPIPAVMLEALRAGGVNLVFDWYDTDKFRPRAFDAELPLIKAAGGGHVRLIISMDILEDGTSGVLREDRWRHLKVFVDKAKASGLLTIIDVHNTGLRGPDGKWTEDFMRGIAEPAMRTRHLRLIRDLATRSARYLDLDWIIIGPGNEPLHEAWYAHQDQLMPAIRAACLNCVVLAMATNWQAIGTTMWRLRPRQLPWWDARFIIDMHMYAPLSLTHCSYPGKPNACPGKTWPGHYSDWLPTGGRFTGRWDRELLEREFAKLWIWQAGNGNPTLHFSEIGTAGDLDDGPRSAYLEDVVAILAARGVGWTCHEWHRNFGIKNAPRTKAACLKGPKLPVPPPARTEAPAGEPADKDRDT